VPIKAPELNLIEVRWWMWMQRIAIAINNSTFENESGIGKAVLVGLRIIIKLTVIQPVIFYTRDPSMYFYLPCTAVAVVVLYVLL
jgi:hypothetical protein